MNNSWAIKNKAIILRKKGLSYGEIKKFVKVSKSTLSFWLKDVKLSEKDKKRLYTKQIKILSQGPQCQKERRQRQINKIFEESAKEINLPITIETYRLLGQLCTGQREAKLLV